jgi:hypothetical protein
MRVPVVSPMSLGRHEALQLLEPALWNGNTLAVDTTNFDDKGR